MRVYMASRLVSYAWALQTTCTRRCGKCGTDLEVTPMTISLCKYTPAASEDLYMIDSQLVSDARFYQHYMVNEQTYVGPYLDNMVVPPTVKPVSWKDFMSATPLEQLPRAYENVVTNRA